MSEKERRELNVVWLAVKSGWRGFVLIVLALVAVGVTSKCVGQTMYCGAGYQLPMLGGRNEFRFNVGGEKVVSTHYMVGGEVTITPGKPSKGGVVFYNGVGSETDRWSLWLKGNIGVEHVFTDAQTDHNYFVYGVGLKVTRWFDDFGVFFEPSMTWNTYSAFISPASERGWYGVRMGVSLVVF